MYCIVLSIRGQFLAKSISHILYQNFPQTNFSSTKSLNNFAKMQTVVDWNEPISRLFYESMENHKSPFAILKIEHLLLSVWIVATKQIRCGLLSCDQNYCNQEPLQCNHIQISQAITVSSWAVAVPPIKQVLFMISWQELWTAQTRKNSLGESL